MSGFAFFSPLRTAHVKRVKKCESKREESGKEEPSSGFKVKRAKMTITDMGKRASPGKKRVEQSSSSEDEYFELPRTQEKLSARKTSTPGTNLAVPVAGTSATTMPSYATPMSVPNSNSSSEDSETESQVDESILHLTRNVRKRLHSMSESDESMIVPSMDSPSLKRKGLLSPKTSKFKQPISSPHSPVVSPKKNVKSSSSVLSPSKHRAIAESGLKSPTKRQLTQKTDTAPSSKIMKKSLETGGSSSSSESSGSESMFQSQSKSPTKPKRQLTQKTDTAPSTKIMKKSLQIGGSSSGSESSGSESMFQSQSKLFPRKSTKVVSPKKSRKEMQPESDSDSESEGCFEKSASSPIKSHSTKKTSKPYSKIAEPTKRQLTQKTETAPSTKIMRIPLEAGGSSSGSESSDDESMFQPQSKLIPRTSTKVASPKKSRKEMQPESDSDSESEGCFEKSASSPIKSRFPKKTAKPDSKIAEPIKRQLTQKTETAPSTKIMRIPLEAGGSSSGSESSDDESMFQPQSKLIPRKSTKVASPKKSQKEMQPESDSESEGCLEKSASSIKSRSPKKTVKPDSKIAESKGHREKSASSPIKSRSPKKTAKPYSAVADSSGSEDEQLSGEEMEHEPQKLRMPVPEGFETVSFKEYKPEIFAEDADSQDMELVLISLPSGFDVSSLNKNQLKLNGRQKFCEKDEIQWSSNCRKLDGRGEYDNFTPLLPSKKTGYLKPVKPFSHHLTFSASYKIPTLVTPEIPPEPDFNIPSGLKYRNIPFGSHGGELSKEKKHHQRIGEETSDITEFIKPAKSPPPHKKKHKDKTSCQESEVSDVVKSAPPHKKKHKDKTSSQEECEAIDVVKSAPPHKKKHKDKTSSHKESEASDFVKSAPPHKKKHKDKTLSLVESEFSDAVKPTSHKKKRKKHKREDSEACVSDQPTKPRKHKKQHDENEDKILCTEKESEEEVPKKKKKKKHKHKKDKVKE